MAVAAGVALAACIAATVGICAGVVAGVALGIAAGAAIGAASSAVTYALLPGEKTPQGWGETLAWGAVLGAVTGGIAPAAASVIRAGQITATQQAVSATIGSAGAVAGGTTLPWTWWSNYPKVTLNGNEYAQIGDRLFTQHAVDRTLPSGLGSPAGTIGSGRSVSPEMVDAVIRTGSATDQTVNGVVRTIYTSGSVSVVTEDGGKLVVTILTR